MKNLKHIFIKIIPIAISIASIITAVTPTNVDNEVLQLIRDIANVIALNVGNAAP